MLPEKFMISKFGNAETSESWRPIYKQQKKIQNRIPGMKGHREQDVLYEIQVGG